MCKHEHTTRVSSNVADRIYCDDCETSWTESEWTDLMDLKLQETLNENAWESLATGN